MAETIEYVKIISQYYVPETKKLFFRRLIEEILLSGIADLINKHYAELLYNNYVTNKFLKEYSHKLPELEVKPSKIHGNGLFSKQKITKDHIITFYPAHFINDDKTGKIYASNEINLADLRLDTFDLHRYQLSGEKEKSLMIIGGHPNLYENHLNGHIANHSLNPNAYYQLVSYSDIITNIWILVSTRFISIGDEILIDYGPMAKKINRG